MFNSTTNFTEYEKILLVVPVIINVFVSECKGTG